MVGMLWVGIVGTQNQSRVCTMSECQNQGSGVWIQAQQQNFSGDWSWNNFKTDILSLSLSLPPLPLPSSPFHPHHTHSLHRFKKGTHLSVTDESIILLIMPARKNCELVKGPAAWHDLNSVDCMGKKKNTHTKKHNKKNQNK